MARQYVGKKSTWVIDGKVYVTTNGDKKYVFRRMKDVNAIMKKGKLNSEMIWKIWKKGKSNSERIGVIWKKIVKDMKNMEETQVE